MQVAERQKPPPGELYLDHVAHFVPDLGAAARLLESLGFTPTPESAHRAQGAPAGTSNRCLMFEEGYVEILAPTLKTPNAERVRAHMARYDGVHLACFGTPDAAFEHQRLAGQGFEPEPLVDLQRTVDGGETVRFSVVYVPPGRMPEGRVQYVQQLTPEVIWKDRFVEHANGVTGLSAVYVAADEPAEAGARWARFSGLLPRREGDLVCLQAARGKVLIGKRTNLFANAPAAPALAGYALSCRHPEAFVARCSKLGLKVQGLSASGMAAGHAITLPPSLGGTWLV
ncbi:MAG TPA: VOC family protein [Burkholderiales bacterium]|nr:VOC family protein [Burkholderiales bacterium]